MKSRLGLAVAAMFCFASVAPANADAYLYEINAFHVGNSPLHLWGPQAFFPRSGKAHTSLMGGWAHELQHRYREALFGHTLFEETPFSLAQFGGEQALISINVLLMSSQ